MAKADTFQYSEEFRQLIVNMHQGKENLPAYQSYIADHMGGDNSRLFNFRRYLSPEIRHHCGDLSSKRCLDFGCGTGATTVVLSENSKNITAFDIDAKSIEICKRRLKEHGLIDKVNIQCCPDFSQIADKVGKFDFILMNGVIEHIPLSMKGLRKQILLSLFNILNEGGYLYINDTPNRLWPRDTHTTGFWFTPWTQPGSKQVYHKAIRGGKHVENPETHSSGPLGLEERGAWGATFFEIKNYFSGKPFEIVNTLPGHDRHMAYSQITGKRKIFDNAAYMFFSSWTRIPITTMAPYINNLVIRKNS